MKTPWYPLDESGDTAAMLIPGGMLVRTISLEPEESGGCRIVAESLCFVPAGVTGYEALCKWVMSHDV